MALALSGCANHHYIPYQGESLGALSPGRFQPSEGFRYDPGPVPVKNSVLSELESELYTVRNLRYPSTGTNGQDDNLVTALYYQSKLEGAHPLVIILPIWGGHRYPSTRFTRSVMTRSRGGAHVLHIQGERRLLDWEGLQAAEDEEAFTRLWEESAAREATAVKDISRAIDWALEQGEVSPDRIALVGFSHGALVAGAAAVQEPRLAATVIVMGGARPHDIFAHCHYRRTRRIQATAQRRFGWSQDEMERRLEPVFRAVDAANFPRRADPSRVLLVDAARDRCISEEGRDDLWKALGRPERITLDYTHQRAFLSMTPLAANWLRRKIWDFLDRTLEIMG